MKRYVLALVGMLVSAWSLAAVNINTATAEELKALPGIGPSKAAAIVEYRTQNGKFKSVDELKNVKGIGEGILSKLKAEAVVSGHGSAKGKAQPVLKK
ncbi:ComEA family DNA-binding protein [Neisseria animaloris]|uniref:ComE1 n=1 Tax=Neisseria animaloris TaxID=326522 RepID=A0A3S4XU75_9NEIS|nr:helix-hairpin-helix domain-containing protein [Neisseria animaloris]VEJ20848.1 ComE1 [Neisseria animaloris]VEJ21987.1 ComE1 [Neisseria animaloris]VEJ22178.1 ComE1 [Neisseria animaloris]